MAIMNQWGDDVDESIGDIAYEAIEEKVKDELKDGAEEVGKAAASVLDKATDHIKPVKNIKDKVKEKLSHNPITRLKNGIRKLKEKAKQAVKNLAKEGLRAVGRGAVVLAKGFGRFAAAHPVIAAIIVIILLAVMAFFDNAKEDEPSNNQTDDYLLESPVYANIDGMSDDDTVVVLMDDCVEQQYDTMFEMVDVEKEEKAKSIYSVFHSYGFNNASIAGMLGNMDIESGLDSSAIEGIFSEYGILGTKKAEALLSLSHYTESVLFPKYKNSGISLNKNGYKTTNADGDTVYYCGLGLVQWTGPNAKTLLTAAKNMSLDWYNMDFQLGYMISDCMYRPNFFTTWAANQSSGLTDDDYDDWFDEYTEGMTDEEIDNLDDAEVAADWEEDVTASWIEAAKESAVHFAHEYEGNTGNDVDRKNSAVLWYSIIADWGDTDVNTEYADAITGLAVDLGAIINFLEIEEAQYRCLSGNVFDNSSLAAAAVSLAWPTFEQSFNNGTNLYQTVHDGIWPTDYTYKACDRGVAAAVRWSGTDIDYPLGTANQTRYLSSSPKWERVAASTSASIGDLLPGDVFCTNGHTFVYVGTEVIQSAYAGEAKPGSDTVSASLNERSPACVSTSSSTLNNGGYDSSGRTYGIYRCINPDESDKYSSIGSGMSN